MRRKFISLFLAVSFLFQQTGLSYALSGVDISGYLSGLSGVVSQDKFRPLHMRYFSYDAQNNDFNLLLDKGDEKELKYKELKEKTAKLLEYFKIGLTLPNDKFWVNLRPDAQDEIIDPDLEKTDIGKILLEADLQLKKDTAGATSPQTAEGKQYWDKLYKKAGELFGSENITIPTITRPWIVPGEVIINTSASAAYIYKANLKVMLEEDYLRSQGHKVTKSPVSQTEYSFNDPRLKELNQYSTQLIRELIIPRLTKEINTAKRYCALRQVFYSLVLAKWFKKTFVGKSGEYSSLIDSNNLTGLISQESWSKLSYFNEYKKSFQDGEYNLKEPVYSPAGQALRSYVSGGALPMEGNPIELNGNISLPAGKNIIPVSLSKGQIAASAIVDKQEAFDLAKKWFNKIFPLHPEGFGNIVLDEDKHYKGTPRYGEREMAVMKKEISAFIRRQYGDSPNDFNEPVYVFAIGIGGQSACVFPAVKHMRRQPKRILIECDSLGIDYSGYENELVAAIRKNPKTKVLWEVGSKSGKTDETMTNFQQVFQMLIRVWSRVEYGDDAGRIIAQELIDKLFDGLPLAEKRPEQLNLKSEEQKILGLVFDGLFMVTGKYDETQKKGSRLDQFRKGFLRQFYQGEDKVASLEMLDNLGGRYQMIGPNTAVLAALFGLNVDDIFAGGKEELLAQRSGDSQSIAIAESLYQADAHHLLIAFPSGIIFSALGEGFDQNIAESTGKGRGIGEPVGLQPYVYTPDTIKDAFSNVKLTGKKAYFIIDVPGLPRIDIEKHKKEGDIVFRYQMNQISEKEFSRLVQFVEGITLRYGTLNTAQILNKKQGEYNLTDIDLSDPEVMRQIMRGPDKTNPAKEGLQKLNDIWKQIDIFLQPDVEDAKKLLAEIARRFLNKEGKTDKGLPVRDKEARKDFYKNISEELNYFGGIIVSGGGLGLINQDGRYVSGDEAAGSLNYLISIIKEGTPLKEGTPSLRLGFIKEHTLSYLKQLYSSSIKDSGYPDTSLANIQDSERNRIRWFKDLHEQLSGKRLSAAQEDTARVLAALLLKAHKSGKTLNFTLYEVKDEVTEILRDFMRHLGIDCVDFGPGVQHKRFQLAAGGNGDTLAMEVIVQSVKEPDYSNIEKEIIKADGNVPDYLHGLLPQEERWLYGKAYSQRFKDVKTETAELLASDLSDETNMLNFMAVLVRMTRIYNSNASSSISLDIDMVFLARRANDKGLLPESALKNILSWEGKEYRSAHQELAKEFEAAGNDPAKWKEINDAWYRQAAIGTAGMRGKMGLGTNRINKFTFGRLAASQAKVVKGKAYTQMLVEKEVFDPKTTKPAVAIGGDTRKGSYDPNTGGPGEFIKFDALINVVMGVKAYVFRRPTTTPQLSWTVANLEVDEGYQIISGSMNTASHNPKTDNGKKPYKYDGSQITGDFVEFLNQELEGQTIAELAELRYEGINILTDTDKAFESAVKNGDIKYLGRPVESDHFEDDAYGADEKFIERELKQGIHAIGGLDGRFDPFRVNLENAKIVISCLGGGAKPILEELLKRRGVKEKQMFWVQSDFDPEFSEVEGGKPNPELESARSTAIKKAVEIDADIVFWLDPDGDRPAFAVKREPHKKAQSADDYLSLNGNQQLAVVANYIIGELRTLAEDAKDRGVPIDKGIYSDMRENAEVLIDNWDKLSMATTVVSGDLMKVIARANGIKTIETLTGFKYIGDEIEKRSEYARKQANIPYRDWQKLSYSQKIGYILRYNSEVILMGGEESLGLTTGLDMHDKDALSGILWLLEIYGRLRAQLLSLDMRLDIIYDKYGYFKEAFPMLQKGSQYSGVNFSEEEAMGIIKSEGESILNYFRNTPLKEIEIAGKKAIAMLDFQSQEAYNRDGKLIFDSTKKGLVTVNYRADDAGVYMDSLMADFGKVPLPKKMSNQPNRAELQGIYSFGHIPLEADKSGKYSSGRQDKKNNLPLENFIMLILEDGSKVIARPSGTEPVIKFYINGRGLYDKRGELDVWINRAYSDLDKITDSIARRRFPEKFASSAMEAGSASRQKDFKGGGIDIKGDSWIQVAGMNSIRELSDVLPRNINREMDIDKELGEIRNLIQNGNIPSPERLGEDIGYCLSKDRFSAYKDDIDMSLLGVGRLKEEYDLDMGKEYLQILFLTHSIVNPFESESYLSED